MNEVQFFGQQDGEWVLYDVKTHPLAKFVELAKVSLAGLFTTFLFWVLGIAIGNYTEMIWLIGLLLGVVIIAVGWYAVNRMGEKNKAYVTDRRVVRFTATSPWASTMRTLSWDEVVKVKTSSTNFWLRTMNIGTVITHARTAEDDITLSGVEYYQDLGNYMDKVLYLYKKEPAELVTLRPFIAKPRGNRY